MRSEHDNEKYLNEIAETLGCHRAFIVETIKQMQEDLKDAMSFSAS